MKPLVKFALYLFVATATLLAVTAASARADHPWADSVVRYNAGGATSFNDANVVLGQPDRTTHESVNYPSTGETVSARLTEPVWLAEQLLTIGQTGELVVSFSQNVQNDSLNPYGVDLLVFTNLGFGSSDYPANDNIADPNGFYGYFGGNIGTISVSQDDLNWYTAVLASPIFPMQGYLDYTRDAYANGATPSDYTRPVNPSLTWADFANISVADAIDLYDGSGGGLGIDLSNLLDENQNAASLDWIRYVRVQGETNALHGFSDVAAVPEPATMTMLLIGAGAVIGARKRGRLQRQK